MFVKTLYRNSNINLRQRLIYDRQAVRAVILRGRELLMVYSANVGDYKFPGGGIHAGETHAQALTREVLEEAGAQVSRIFALMGTVTEYDQSIEPGYDLFKMTSYYYRVEIAPALVNQHLDEYESELGFEPVWVEIGRAIQVDTEILETPNFRTPFWTRRELDVLQELAARIETNGSAKSDRSA